MMSQIASPGVARRPNRLRRVAVAVVIAAGLVYVASTPVLTAIGHQLVRSDPLERADAIVVLAPWLGRVLEAADLYQKGYAPLIVLTREERQPAEQMMIDRGVLESGEQQRRRVLESLGVKPDSVVILDDFIASTAGEAQAFARWARGRSIRTAIVVTSPYHTGRSRVTFARALEAQKTKVLVHPSRLGGTFEADTWWKSRSSLRDGLFEWQKLLYYKLVELPRMPVNPAPAR